MRELRDRALIATLTYSFARVTAVLKMRVEDLRPRGAGWELRLREKGGKHHVIPCHHVLAEALQAYIADADIGEELKGWLFRTAKGWKATTLADQPMDQSDAWRMVRRRAAAAGHQSADRRPYFPGDEDHGVFGKRRHARTRSGHGRARESPHHQLYDRTKEPVTLDETERIRL